MQGDVVMRGDKHMAMEMRINLFLKAHKSTSVNCKVLEPRTCTKISRVRELKCGEVCAICRTCAIVQTPPVGHRGFLIVCKRNLL